MERITTATSSPAMKRTNDRIVIIETAAQRLGLTVMGDSKVSVTYEPPSLEEDMQDFNIHVFGDPNHINPEVEIQC